MGGAGHGRCWAARAGRRVTLGALARETSRIRLGTLLSSATSSAGGTAGGTAGEPADGPFSFTRLRHTWYGVSRPHTVPSAREAARSISLHPPTASPARRTQSASRSASWRALVWA